MRNKFVLALAPITIETWPIDLIAKIKLYIYIDRQNGEETWEIER